jgi:hypothetical protein
VPDRGGWQHSPTCHCLVRTIPWRTAHGNDSGHPTLGSTPLRQQNKQKAWRNEMSCTNITGKWVTSYVCCWRHGHMRILGTHPTMQCSLAAPANPLKRVMRQNIVTTGTPGTHHCPVLQSPPPPTCGSKLQTGHRGHLQQQEADDGVTERLPTEAVLQLHALQPCMGYSAFYTCRKTRVLMPISTCRN